MISGKTSPIRYETQLASEFRKLFEHDTRVEGIKLSPPGHPKEAVLQLDGLTHHFELHFLLVPTLEDIPTPNSKALSQPLLVVPRLSDAFLEACRRKNVNVADLNGRLYLRAPGILVSHSPLPGRDFRFEHEPRNVYVGKSVRIV